LLIKALLTPHPYTVQIGSRLAPASFYKARQIGVREVPFFDLENKYTVSGLQPSELFVEVLKKSS
jgi:predicted DsbA family dithiol-disulfide isomerase